MRKQILFLSAFLTTVAASAAGVSVKWADQYGSFLASGISENHKYVCGTGTIWNVETGEIVTSYYENLRLQAVDDTGFAVGALDDYAASFNMAQETDYIDGMDFVNLSTSRDVTADGGIIVGSRFDDVYHQEPGYWQNGEFHRLPLPEKYEDMPQEVEIYGVAAGGVSADGSVIVGNIITGTAAEAVVMWTRNDAGEYEFHPLYAGFMEFGMEEVKPYIYISAQKVSSNGKWISLVLQLNSWEDFRYYAGRYNVETREIECAGLLAGYSECDYYATGIANDGTVVGFLEQEEMLMAGRRSYIWMPDSDTPEDVSACFDSNNDLDIIENSVATVYTDLSGDGKSIVGFMLTNEYSDSFVIDLIGGGSGIDSVAVETEKKGANGIFTLQGTRVTGRPIPGIYIEIENGKSKKVVVR